MPDPSTRPPARTFTRRPDGPQYVDVPPRRQRQVWVDEVYDPPPGVDYTRVLSGPGHSAGIVVGGVVAAVLAFMMVAPGVVQTVVLGLGYLLRGRPDGSYEAYGTNALGFQYPEGMVAAHLMLAAMVPVALLLVRFLHRRRPVWLTSVQPGMRWRYLVLVAVVAAVVLNGVYWFSGGAKDFVYDPQPGWITWVVLVVLTAPLQAAGEEYLFRGYLTQVFGSFIKIRWVAVVLSALLFAAAHGTGQNLPMFASRFGFGLLMGVIVVVTGGLEAAIAAHAVNNVSTFLYAAASQGGVASAMAVKEVNWSQAAWNLAAYALVGVIAWTVGLALRAAKTTPAT